MTSFVALSFLGQCAAFSLPAVKVASSAALHMAANGESSASTFTVGVLGDLHMDPRKVRQIFC